MDSEEAPLLSENVIAKHEAVYRRFSPGRKKVLVAMVSWTGLLPLFIGGTFIPSIPQIAEDLKTTGAVISLAVSLSVLASSLGALVASSYSTFYGRRPIYLSGLPLLVVGSVGVAMSKTIPELMVSRFIQASGASPGMSVGAGVIGDIYKLEERGTAMGIYFAAILLGPAFAPVAGGAAARYASWRAMQLAIGVAGFLALIIMLFFFPETKHPGTREIEKLRADGKYVPTWRPVLLNPLRPLWLLRSPNLMAMSLSGFFVLLTDYALLVPIAYTIGERYNITNPALIGACFIPCGLGNMIGAPLAGHLSDKIVVRWREKRGGIWYPEDRLRATLTGAMFFVPVSVLGCGIATRYVDGRLGLTLNLIFLFMNGIGVDIVLSPSAAYTVDVMHARSAESMAANNGFRSMITSVAIAGILPMIDTYGVLVTNTIVALLAWMGCLLIWLTIRYGDRMRAWIDVGYSTAENN